MIDDQFKELISHLAAKSVRTLLLRKAIDATVLALIVSVTVGFFTMIWQGHSGYGKAIHNLKHNDRILEIKNQVSMEILAKEVITLQEEHDRVYSNHDQDIEEIRQEYEDTRQDYYYLLDELQRNKITVRPPPPQPAGAAKKVDTSEHVGSPLKAYEEKKKKLFDRFRNEVRQQVQQMGTNAPPPHIPEE